MKLLNVLIFILAFTIELRVRASDVVPAEKIIETPDSCVQESGYCIIKNLNKRYSYNNEDFTISFSPESILVRQKTREFSFVRGDIFVKSDSKISFEIPYGTIEIDPGSQVLLFKQSDKVVVQTIFGKVFLKPLGYKKSILVMAGHENFISQVGEGLKAQTGIPKPIMIEPLLKAWSYHADVKKEKFLEDVDTFKSIHEKAVQELSILNEQIASREIASAKAEKAAREESARKAREQRQKRQNTYYQRLLSE